MGDQPGSCRGIIVTTHAKERGRERFHLSAEELATLAALSLDSEDSIDVLHDPTLRPLAINSALRHDASGMYSFRGIVFIFRNQYLVTVYPVSWLGMNRRDFAA